MKPKTPQPAPGFRICVAAIALGLTGSLVASPQLPPKGVAEVVEFIQTDVSADPQMNGADVSIRIDDGIAVISGEAKSLSQAERATARTIANSAVRGVVNCVSIKPGDTASIAGTLKLALASQKMVQCNSVKPSISSGRVTLSGKVGTLDEKDLVREIVAEIPGIVAIQNDIEVTFEGIRKDSQIQEQLRILIKHHPLYTGLDLKVSVKDGVARLGGEVGTRGEFDRLVRRCYVTGVIDVQIDGLSIDSNLAMEGLTDKNYSDEEASSVLGEVLRKDSRLDPGTISVSVREGVVTLKGNVRRLVEKDAAESAARSIPGVLSVSSKLKISEGSMLAAGKRDLKMASAPSAVPRR